ncbi:MAG: hypothetical protein ACXVJK_07905, partial [Candidatus Aminicenantales bacterium]
MSRPFRATILAGQPVPAAGRRPPALRIIDGGLAALLVLSPLPAASVNEWSVLIIELAAGLMAAAYVLLEPKPRLHGQMAPALRWMKFAALGFFGFLSL